MTNIWVPPRNIPFHTQDDPNFGGSIPPIYYAPLLDSGNGVASINPTIYTPNPAFPITITFTRPSTAYTRLSTGYWTSLGVDQPRHYYGVQEGAVFNGRSDGLLIEPTKTNICLWSRDMTQANWVKVNINAAKDQVGIDGISNSASSITATIGGGTILQNLSPFTGVFSAYVRRVSGSGTLEMTTNGGGAWTNITSLVDVSPNNWTPLPCYLFSFLAGNVGFRVGTAADKFAIDMNQLESTTLGGVTSPIPTLGVTATRAAESFTIIGNQINLFPYPQQFSMGATVSFPFEANFPIIPVFSSYIDVNNTNAFKIVPQSSNVSFAATSAGQFKGTNVAMDASSLVRGVQQFYMAINDSIKGASIYTYDGIAPQLPSSVPVVWTNPFAIGGIPGNVPLSGAVTIKYVQLYNRVLDQAQYDTLTAKCTINT